MNEHTPPAAAEVGDLVEGDELGGADAPAGLERPHLTLRDSRLVEQGSVGQNKLELVRQALAGLGDVPDGDLLAFLERKHGVRMDPKFLPVVRASLRGLEQLVKAREAARAAAEKVVAEQTSKKKPRKAAPGPTEPPISHATDALAGGPPVS